MDVKDQTALVDKCVEKSIDAVKDLVEKAGGKISDEKTKELSEQIEKALGEKSEEELKKISEEIEANAKALKDGGDASEAMQKQLDELGIKVEKMPSSTKEDEPKTLDTAIKAFLEGEMYTDYTKGGGNGSTKTVNLIETKDVTWAGMTNQNNIIAPQLVGPQVSFAPPEPFNIRALLPGLTSAQSNLRFTQEESYTDNIGFLAENAASLESDLNLNGVTINSTRLATHVDVSKEAMDDIPYLVGHITRRLGQHLTTALNNSVINGDGTSNTIDGLFNNAATVTAGGFAASITNAQFADAIVVAAARMAEISNVDPTVVLMHPNDAAKLTLIKDQNDNYLKDIIVSRTASGLLMVGGITVVKTYEVPEDEFLLLELSAALCELVLSRNITMRVSEDHGTNAIENKVTFILESNWILPIYATYRMIKGDFSVFIAAITV